MGFIEAIRTVLGKYATFDGRARRSEFWWWQLLVLLLSLFGGSLAYGWEAGEPLAGIISLLLFLPGLAVAVRRLHDTDRSGWFILLIFLPIIGPLLLIWWYLKPGTPGTNRFGPDPA